jgi:hypothetical protein
MLRDGRPREAYQTIAQACREAGVPVSRELMQKLAAT